MSLIFPVMPFIKKEYNFSAFEMGLMSSLFALVQFYRLPNRRGASLTKLAVSR
jgi:DHA1 family multidrug resistance protein-like MFS transporter